MTEGSKKVITIPELALVLLVGPSGSGKSTFGKTHFKATEIISSDFCRGLVSDDENNQASTKDAFEVLQFIASKRLAAGKLTVIDATNVQPEARKPLVALAREYHCLPVAIVLNMPLKVCQERNRGRSNRDFSAHVIPQQINQLSRSLRFLEREGFRHVVIMDTPEQAENVRIVRQPLWNNLKNEHGPFDVIGDVHGCFNELHELVKKLGYETARSDDGQYEVSHPNGRKLIFIGDLVDRGPNILEVIKFVMSAVRSGNALCVPGNHDIKLVKKLKGKDVKISHGLAETLAQLEKEPQAFRGSAAEFLHKLVSHYVLDDGKLVVAHAGMKESMQGRGSGKVRDFALFGETTGEIDEFGLPVRYNWAAEYRGKALVVYGHTPVPEAEWLNNTACIDTGCVFGGKLTALRYPEKEFVSVPAACVYYKPVKPFLADPKPAGNISAQQAHDEILDIDDIIGKKIISTSLHHTVTIREENAIAALEVMSRFALNPKWLVYLPPTMPPPETTTEPGLLEHPNEAFSYFRKSGISKIICEEKHMGSRAAVIVGKDADVIRRRFGIIGEGLGACYTRTGRKFINDPAMESEFLRRIHAAVSAAKLWDILQTDWILLDCELMPWSAKAQDLILEQYASVGTAAKISLDFAVEQLRKIQSEGSENLLLTRFADKDRCANLYRDAYRRYCWPVKSIDDYKLAPFHILATEGHVHHDKNHVWHMETIGLAAQTDPHFIIKTPYKLVDLSDEESQKKGVAWWSNLTRNGGEGMVVKPLEFVGRNNKGIIQPAIKCRGPEYLRIIYGPEYDAPENLARLRNRSLNSKRSLALREFALGIEALERFIKKEPLRLVHECVFGILALESEPVDPRL